MKYVLSKLKRRKTIPVPETSATVRGRMILLEYAELIVDLDEELVEEVLEVCDDRLEGYVGDGWYRIPVDVLIEVCQDEIENHKYHTKSLEYPKKILSEYKEFSLEPYEELEDLW
jgi:hypothetical protein